MKFSFRPLSLPEVILIEHELAADERGFFAESFRAQAFAEAGIRGPFVQENHSRSRQGVLRGLHYQKEPRAQGKLVRCVRGRLFDVAVDIRLGSPNYGKWVGQELTDENRSMLYIPAGFAHGLCTLSDWADVIYRQTDYYSPEHERGIRWDDPTLAIDWPVKKPSLSTKDAALPSLQEADNNFLLK